MMAKEKARPAGSAAGQADVGNAVTGNIPLSDCTTPSQPAQASVFERLPQGEDNAIKAKDLARQCGFKSARDLQHAIALEREAGALILSTCRHGGGYYRPSDGVAGRQEVAAFMRTLRARAINTLRAIRAAREALERLDGQIELPMTDNGKEGNHGAR